MGAFWVPRYKYEYVEWFVNQKILERSKANRMSLKQLKGKYFEVRLKGG